MKKKVLLTIVLVLGIVLFVNLVVHFSYQTKYAIDELMIVPETMAYGIKKRLAQWIIYAIFSVFNIVLYGILIIKTWKKQTNNKI